MCYQQSLRSVLRIHAVDQQSLRSACAYAQSTSKGSDQPAHTHSLMKVFTSRLNIIWVLGYWPISIRSRSLYLSKYHIVKNHMSRLNNGILYNYWLMRHWIWCEIDQRTPILTEAKPRSILVFSGRFASVNIGILWSISHHIQCLISQ